MNIIVSKNKEELAEKAALTVKELVSKNPKAILGLATGSSPLELYAHLASYCREGLSFSEVKSFNLDEYIACPIVEQTYAYFMKENLFSKIDIRLENTHFPNQKDPEAYDAEIEEAGGVDLQILGIGRNGHIGFNEPGTSHDSKTHIIDLTESTRSANARFFRNDIDLVPTQAVSMGLSTIMKARKIVLIANDVTKAEPIAALLMKKKTLDVPATVLLDHPDCDVFLPEDVYEAAKKLVEASHD